MRLIFSLAMLIALGFGGWWTWDNVPEVREFVLEKIQKGEFRTLEIRFTAEQIMGSHQKALLKGDRYSYNAPELTFYPYLLMEVKYPIDQYTTAEGVLLWGLTDGEMVINAKSWERTHGYEDCLLASADQHDFNLIRSLVRAGGRVDRDRLYRTFNVECDIVDGWLDSCQKKKLIVLSGNQYRLHFSNPKFEIQPQTAIDEPLVTHSARLAQKVKKRYSPAQIKKLCNLAFGKDFAIRNMSEVFLPVYSIGVQNPDGSTLTTFWNALNGRQITELPL
ncbi:MAG: hypothetical protein KDK55_05075 [Chlamydiia bacterium]|nr:hypothetical protein [Chlamydiia bacterium]